MSDNVIDVNDGNFDKEVLDYTGVVVLDFYTDGCPPCKMMSPIIDQIADERKDTVKVVKIDAYDALKTTGNHEIMAVPTFIIYKNGEIKDQATGMKTKEEFDKWIDEFI